MLRSVFAFAVAFWPIVGAAAKSRPNIVIILADDMGYSDIGAYGSEIPTPNIDRLAKEGIRFARFYNTSRCCPTRAALLTGLYQHQAGIGHMIDDYAKEKRVLLGGPAYTTKLNDRCVTIAEVLGEAGYDTMMAGKWHVGSEREAWPDRRGFARSFCVVGGAMNYFGSGTQHVAGPTAMQLALDGKPWTVPREGFYSTDAFTDRAIAFLEERKEPARPFFLYLAYNAPHWPLHALPEDIARHRGKYREGFENIRAPRLQRQIAAGLFPPSTALAPREAVAVWENLSDEQRDEWDLRMAIYAAQVESMDRGIGRLLTALRELGAEQNTLVIFMSDNGGCHEQIDRGKPGAELGTRDSYSSYRRAWSEVSNTPFRFHKHWTHEGGIATPCVARWPSQIAPDTFTHEIGHVMDLMPTALAAAGVEYPKTFARREIQPVEGVSLLPALRGERMKRALPIFWEHEGNRAVRDGKWKLVSRFPGDWELYDLDVDPTERKDLAGANADRVRQLADTYDAWAARCNVRPWSLTVKEKADQ
jgi:arylsulfatase A-like enzyme